MADKSDKPWKKGKGAAQSGKDKEPEGLSDSSIADALLAALGGLTLAKEEPAPAPLLSSFDMEGVAALIKEKRAAGEHLKVIVMCGAGISVSAGIPDFRTPGTGLYDNLQKYNLPYPTAVFEIGFLRKNPEPFYTLARELYPGLYSPTPFHYFLRLLHDKGLLLRCFTQNIDSLEALAGVPKEKIVAAHGNFDSARCIDCNKEHETSFVKEHVMRGEVCRCTECEGIVKPDIVFFGENLPPRFFRLSQQDFPRCDLLIVAGTSLVVHPFAGLVDRVGRSTPRLLMNREKVGEMDPELVKLSGGKATRGFVFGEGNYRDALFLGDCDSGCRELASLLGWSDELEEMVKEGHAALAAAREAEEAAKEEEGVPEARDVK